MLEQERPNSQVSTKTKDTQHLDKNKKKKKEKLSISNCSNRNLKTRNQKIIRDMILNFIILPFTQWNDKKNQLLSSSLLPDIYLWENCVIVQIVLHIAVALPGRELQTQRWRNQIQIGLWNKISKN